MQCPKCGYDLQPFDTTCPKCARIAQQPTPMPQQPIQQPYQQPQQAYQAAPVYLDYAGFGTRLLALMVDLLILCIPLIIMGAAIGVKFSDFSDPQAMQATRARLQPISNIVNVIALLYYGLFESSVTQATPGKMLMGIKVGDMDGNRLSVGHALLRSLLRFVSGFLCDIGFIMAAFTEKKQGLHDMIAKTTVSRS